MPGSRYKVSDLLESMGQPEQRETGADLADYLIKMDWRKFRRGNSGLPQPQATEVNQYDPALISDVLERPHHYTTTEAVTTLVGALGTGIALYRGLLDYYQAMQHPLPENATNATISTLHRLIG